MIKQKARLIVYCSLFPLLLAGCEGPREKPGPGAAEVQAQVAGDVPADFTMFDAPVLEQEQDLRHEAAQRFEYQDFKHIEENLARYRRPGQEFVNGKSKLILYYLGLGDNATTEKAWRENEPRFQQWRKLYPHSMGLSVALANHYYDGAFLAQEGKTQSDLNPRQRNLRSQRLAMAQKALEDGKAASTRCPGWYFMAQTIAIQQGISFAELSALTEKANAQFPGFRAYEYTVIFYLTSTHRQGPQKWQQYAAGVADKLGGEAGDRFYARAVWSLLMRRDSDISPHLKTFDWPRAKRGFQSLMAGFDTSSVMGAYALAAWLARDRATLKHLFQDKIGNQADQTVWADYNQYTTARKWALEDRA